MSKSRRSSNASAPCRPDWRFNWRPSLWLGGGLWALALLAPLGLLASDLPAAWAWPLAIIAGVRGIVLARRYWRQPTTCLVIPSGRGQPTCNDLPITGLAVAWRGPLAFLRWHDAQGRLQRLAFWPDTLPAGMRRELQMVMQRRDPASPLRPVAG